MKNKGKQAHSRTQSARPSREKELKACEALEEARRAKENRMAVFAIGDELVAISIQRGSFGSSDEGATWEMNSPCVSQGEIFALMCSLIEIGSIDYRDMNIAPSGAKVIPSEVTG